MTSGGGNPYLRPNARAALRDALAQTARHRLSLAEVHALARHASGRAVGPAARRFLAELCDMLVGDGVLRAVVSAGLDTAEYPPIPARFHNLLAPGAMQRPLDVGLHPLLPAPPRSWRGTPELARLNRWIAEVDSGRRTAREEPLRRRMLEIFGIEKARRGLAPHLAQFPDWLGERGAILRIIQYVHPGSSWRGAPGGDTVLMVENAETFGVLRQVLMESPVERVRELVFGSGNALAMPLDGDFARLVYFGDWDLDGLASLSRLAGRDRRVVPWSAAYRRLLDFPPVEGFSPRKRRLADAALAACAPGDLLDAARELECHPRLIPQEWLGLQETRRLVGSLATDDLRAPLAGELIR